MSSFTGPCDFTTSGICRYALGNPCDKCPFKAGPMNRTQAEYCTKLMRATAARRNETLREGWERRLAKHAWPGSSNIVDFIEAIYVLEVDKPVQ